MGGPPVLSFPFAPAWLLEKPHLLSRDREIWSAWIVDHPR